MNGRIRPSIHVGDRDANETVIQLAQLPLGVDFAAMEIRRHHHSYGDERPAGSVYWVWVETIGDRSAIDKMPGLLPRFFDVGKCRQRRHSDADGHSVFVRKYAGDRWKMRVDARDFRSQAEVDKCVATYWPESLEIPFLDPAAEAMMTAISRITEATADEECRPDAIGALLAEMKRLVRRPAARAALAVAIERKLGLTATLRMMRRSHLQLVLSNKRAQ